MIDVQKRISFNTREVDVPDEVFENDFIEGTACIKEDDEERLLAHMQRVLDNFSDKQGGEVVAASLSLILSWSSTCSNAAL